jgi:hypothetical protein
MTWLFLGVAALGAGALALRCFKPWLEQILRPGPEAGAGEPALRQITPLDRMIDELRRAKDPLERQRLLGEIVEESYRRRAAPAMYKLFMRFAAMQVQEVTQIIKALKAANGGRMPDIPAFPRLAAALEEDGRLEEALSVCAQARKLGLKDGPKAGFSGRIKKLRKKIKDARSEASPPGCRRGAPSSRP